MADVWAWSCSFRSTCPSCTAPGRGGRSSGTAPWSPRPSWTTTCWASRRPGVLDLLPPPEDIDPDQLPWPREVERATYDAAVAAGQVTVRVLDGSPASSRVEGHTSAGPGSAHPGRGPAAPPPVLLLWRFGRYGRPELLRLEAIGDVTPPTPASRRAGPLRDRRPARRARGDRAHVVVLDAGPASGRGRRRARGPRRARPAGQVPGRRVM